MSRRRAKAVDFVDDLPALVEHLSTHPRFQPELVTVLSALQERPGALDTLRADLREYQQRLVDLWRGRTILSLEHQTLESFCALATERARTREASFPALTPEGLEVKSSWRCGWLRTKDVREGGVGWLLEAEERDEGPAEAVHNDEWAARAYGGGWAIAVRYDTTSGEHWSWEEPTDPLPGADGEERG